jgi:hypothetical protein
MNSLIRKKFSRLFNKFDTVAEKTIESCSSMLKHFNEHYEIGRAGRYSDVKNLLINTKKAYGNIPFINKLLISPNHADWISRYVGGTTALSAVKLTIKLGKYSASVAASLGVLSYLQPNLDMSNRFNAIMVSSGLLKMTPMTATAALVMIGFSVYAFRNVRKMYADGQFYSRRDSLNVELLRTAVSEAASDGKIGSPKLDYLLNVYRSEFKPDFSPEETDKIIDVVTNKGSETALIAEFTKEQQDTINKLARKLTTGYFVPDHLAHNAVLTMLAEANGNSRAISAKLNSRRIDEEWVNRFQMDPLSRAQLPAASSKPADLEKLLKKPSNFPTPHSF